MDLDDVGDGLVAEWCDLESRAVEPNPFLSPRFVLPAMRYLEPGGKVLALLVEKKSPGNNSLAGVGLFMLARPSKYFPLPHLAAFHTKYSFLSGLLIDRDCVDDAIGIIFSFLVKTNGKWHSVVIHDKAAEGISADAEKRAADEFGMAWISFKEWERAELPMNDRDRIGRNLGKNMRKSLCRRMRRLRELGDVKFEVRSNGNLTEDVVDRFLALENMGWKGEQGTSIYSDANDAQFFREMVGNFNKAGQVFFNELYLNNTVIASNVNIVSGKAGFGFKLGWDPEFAKLSTGNLLESFSFTSTDPIYFRLDFIDSGADGDAEYLNALWPGRRKLKSGVYAISGAAKALAPLMGLSARLVKGIRSEIRRRQA